jgi:hypothetical protein
MTEAVEVSHTDQRGYPRLEMYAGVFMTQGERAHLSELTNISAGGARIQIPASWQRDMGGVYHLYFILDQDRILCIRARVMNETDDAIGFKFEPGYAIQAEQLLAESRNWR